MPICSRPAAIKRRRLKQQNRRVNPELASLYHDECPAPPIYNDASPPPPILLNVLGRSRPFNQSRKRIFGRCGLASLIERMRKILQESSNNNNNNNNMQLSTTPTTNVLDLRDYQFIPRKIKASFSTITDRRRHRSLMRPQPAKSTITPACTSLSYHPITSPPPSPPSSSSSCSSATVADISSITEQSPRSDVTTITTTTPSSNIYQSIDASPSTGSHLTPPIQPSLSSQGKRRTLAKVEHPPPPPLRQLTMVLRSTARTDTLFSSISSNLSRRNMARRPANWTESSSSSSSPPSSPPLTPPSS